MKSRSTVNHILLIAASTLTFSVLGCDNGGVGTGVGVGDSYVPRVRLVKDGDFEFHFQWDEPLKEERIILFQSTMFGFWYSEVDASNNLTGQNLYFNFSDFPDDYPDSTSSYQLLIHFPEGAFISEPNEHFTGWHGFIEILPASERNAFPLPAYVVTDGVFRPNFLQDDPRFRWRILKEHPFKPYRVGKSSRITFDEKPELNN